MKLRTSLVLLATLFVGVTLCFAADPNLGTWKLNETKSKIDTGAPKNLTVTYEATGDSLKATVDGVDGKGNPTHSEWTGKFDGKDYPLTGDPTADTRAVKQIDEHHLELTAKKDGKVTMTGKLVVAADGKSRTLTIRGTDPMGKKFHSVAVYDKQ
jgi:hypothetical protein